MRAISPRESNNLFVFMGVLGINWAVSMVVWVLAGNWVDGYFHTRPFFMLAGVFLGLASGMLGTIRIARRFMK